MIEFLLKKGKKISFYDIIFCFIIFCIPLKLKISNVLVLLITCIFLFKFKTNLKNISFNLSFLFLGLFIFFSVLISGCLGLLDETNYNLFLPTLLLPVLYTKVDKKDLVLITIITIVLSISIYSNYNLLIHYLKNGYFLPFEGEIINKLLGLERPYLGFLSILASISSMRLSFIYTKNTFIFKILAFYFIAFIFFISARISVITVIILFLVFFTFYFQISRVKKVFFISISILSVYFFVSINSNLKDRFFVTKNFDEFLYKLNRHEPRVITWNCAYEIAKEETFNPLTGLGSKETIDNLLAECYLEKIENKHRSNYFISSKKNTHNQFLNIYLMSGVFGLLFFTFYFLFQLGFHKKNFLNFAIIISTILFMLVENMLSREMGSYIFGLTIALSNFYQKK